jgi:hypothetical protein
MNVKTKFGIEDKIYYMNGTNGEPALMVVDTILIDKSSVRYEDMMGNGVYEDEAFSSIEELKLSNEIKDEDRALHAFNSLSQLNKSFIVGFLYIGEKVVYPSTKIGDKPVYAISHCDIFKYTNNIQYYPIFNCTPTYNALEMYIYAYNDNASLLKAKE